MTSEAKLKITGFFWSTVAKIADLPDKSQRYRKEMARFSSESKETPSPEAHLLQLIRNYEQARDKEKKTFFKSDSLSKSLRKHLQFSQLFKEPLNLMFFFKQLDSYLSTLPADACREDPFFGRILAWCAFFEAYLVINRIPVPAILKRVLIDCDFHSLLTHLGRSPLQKAGMAVIKLLPQFMLVADLSDEQYSTLIKTLLLLLDKKEDLNINSRDLIIKKLAELAARPTIAHTQREQICKVLLSHLPPGREWREGVKFGKLLGHILHFYSESEKNDIIATLQNNLDNHELIKATLNVFEGVLTHVDIDVRQYEGLVQTVIQKNLNVCHLLHPLITSTHIHQGIREKITELLLKQFDSKPSGKTLEPLYKLIKKNSVSLNEERHSTLILKLAESKEMGNPDLQVFYIKIFRHLIQNSWVTEKLWESLLASLSKSLCEPQKAIQALPINILSLLRLYPKITKTQSDKVFEVLMRTLDSAVLRLPYTTIQQLTCFSHLSDEQWQRIFDSFMMILKKDCNFLPILEGSFFHQKAIQKLTDQQFNTLFRFLMTHIDHTSSKIQESVLGAFRELTLNSYMNDKHWRLLFEPLQKKLTFPNLLNKSRLATKLTSDMFFLLWNNPLKTDSGCPELTPALMTNLITAEDFLSYWKKLEPKPQKEALDDLLQQSASRLDIRVVLRRILESDIPISIQQFQKSIQFFLKHVDKYFFPLEACIAKALQDKSRSPAFICSLCESMIAYTGALPLQLHMRYAIKKELHLTEMDETLNDFLAHDPPSIVKGYYN